MISSEHVLRRVLVAKQLLLTAGGPLAEHSDPVAVAKAILTAHDAAELTLAAIASHLHIPGLSDRSYLMDYVGEIAKQRPAKPLPGADFFRSLNSARRSFKHEGILPDAREWHRVIDRTWRHVDQCVFLYLDTTFDDIDLISLVGDQKVRDFALQARTFIRDERPKEALECIGQALYLVLDVLPGMRPPQLGTQNAHQAMMLAAYGIRPSDFLSLQEFVPTISKHAPNTDPQATWDTRKTGHPGNWTTRNANFCLEALIDVAVKTQHTPWHPSPVSFYVLYRDVIRAVRDGVPLWRYQQKEGRPVVFDMDKRIDVKVLRRGESMRGTVVIPPGQGRTLGELLGHEPSIDAAEVLAIWLDGPPEFVYFNRGDFELSYEPKEDPTIRRYFPHIFD